MAERPAARPNPSDVPAAPMERTPMTARWLLVRHGDTVWSGTGRYAGHSDVALSARGREQARRLAARLAGEPVAVAYTSDLARARETLALLLEGRAIQPEVVLCSELRELHFGAWEGRSYPEIAREPAAPAILRGDAAPPDGESLAQLATRVTRFLARLRAETTERPRENAMPAPAALVVAHGGPLRVMLCAALGLPPEAHWRFQVEPAGLSELAWDPHTGPRLVRLNDRCHLTGRQ